MPRRNPEQLGMFGLPEPPKAATRRKVELFEEYGEQGAPQPGQRGYRAAPQFVYSPDEAARSILASTVALNDDPDTYTGWYSVWAFHSGGWEPDEVFSVEGWDDPEIRDEMREMAEDYMDARGIPYTLPDGTRLSFDERVSLAIFATDLSLRVLDRVPYGVPETAHRAEWQQDEYGRLPLWAAVAILSDTLAGTAGKQRLRLVNVSKAEAARFIEQHHSALPYINARGIMYALGAVYGDRLVAVATAGSPTAQWRRYPAKQILELTRIASDGTVRNASSMLAARLLDLLPQSGRDPESGYPPLFVTYSLTSESGTSYRALKDRGLRPVAFMEGKEPTGARKGGAGEDAALARVDKIRWEAGEMALPAQWSLLDDPAVQERLL